MTTKSYPLGERGTLVLAFPADWKDALPRIREVATNMTLTFDAIQFQPATGSNWSILIQLVPLNETNIAKLDIKALALERGQGLLAGAVETNPAVQELKGVEAQGYYFDVTDRQWTNASPPPGAVKYGMNGSARMGRLLLNFFVGTNDKDIEKQALDVISNARLTPP